jgi:flagellin-like hook-associated protein FlgL
MESLQLAREKAISTMAALRAADAGLEEIENILLSLRELAVRASQPISAYERMRIGRTTAALINEIDMIVAETNYMGKPLLTGHFEARA